MKYRSKLGTVINIPDGLGPKQIAKIKADADAGYGTRAQATAKKLGASLKKKTAAPPAPPADREFTGLGKRGYGQGLHGSHVYKGAAPEDSKIADTADLGGVVNPKTGTVNADKGLEAIGEQTAKDVENQFNLDHPMRMTDQYGNVRVITRDPVTGQVTITDELGGAAQTFKDLATAAASTFNGDVSRQKAEEATYGTLTKYYDRDMQRELEAQKQEMANRGIPYDPAAANDPNTQNLYGKTIGAVQQKYQGMKDDASKQAILAGNQAYATDAQARDSFLTAAMQGATSFGGSWTPYQNTIDSTLGDKAADLIKLSAESYMAKYGIDKDAYLKEKAIAASKSNSGGGGSGGGFEITG